MPPDNNNVLVTGITGFIGSHIAIKLLNAGYSKDPDNKIQSYSWNFGDGNKAQQGIEVSHIYNSPGKYNIILD